MMNGLAVLIGELILLSCSDAVGAMTPSKALLYSLHHDEAWDMSSPHDHEGHIHDHVASENHSVLLSLRSVNQHVPAAKDPRDKPLTLEEAAPAVIMATLAGLSTVLGALVVCCMPAGGVPRSAMSFGLSLAAGVMITVSFMELVPEDITSWRHNAYHFILFMVGGILTCAICNLAGWLEKREADGEIDAEVGQDLSVKAVERRSWRLAVLLFISLTAHNLPEGLAVAISAMANKRLGFTVMIAIAVHNIPEGVAVAIPTYDATKSQCKAVLVALLSGMTETVGALIAILVLQPFLTGALIEDLLIFVAGIMCYIAFFELLPESVYGGGMMYAVASLGLITGAAIMILTHMLLEEAMHDDHDHDHHDHHH
jgi:ZIP family zinc transporter